MSLTININIAYHSAKVCIEIYCKVITEEFNDSVM